MAPRTRKVNKYILFFNGIIFWLFTEFFYSSSLCKTQKQLQLLTTSSTLKTLLPVRAHKIVLKLPKKRIISNSKVKASTISHVLLQHTKIQGGSTKAPFIFISCIVLNNYKEGVLYIHTFFCDWHGLFFLTLLLVFRLVFFVRY